MRKCLICKTELGYYGICGSCRETNRRMREMHEDLSGRNALVTGGRVRIGYAACLRLLRDGARVIAVTRFPYDAVRRYSQEPDYEQWRDRLTVCGFDLMRADRLGELVEFVKSTFPEGLDILINNAAQTIRKTPSYYAQLEAEEQRLSALLPGNTPELSGDNGEEIPLCKMPVILTKRLPANEESFPVPYREETSPAAYETPLHNSWVSKAEEISPAEMLEVQLINVTAPFLLTGQLKGHMEKCPRKNKFIINVSSVEGRFNSKKKLSRHVHTNMAKVSLNMMTHSLSGEYAAAGIYIYSVDPGWVSNQFPAEYAVSKEFVPYLSCDDGAARICYPIYLHLNDTKKPSDTGALYKDFKIMEY